MKEKASAAVAPTFVVVKKTKNTIHYYYKFIEMKKQLFTISTPFLIAILLANLPIKVVAQQTPSNLTSIAFDMRKGGNVCINIPEAGTDTPTPTGEPNNSAGLVLPGQEGLWHHLNAGSGFLTICCPTTSSTTVNGITFTLNTAADIFESFTGGSAITDALREPIIFLRNNICHDGAGGSEDVISTSIAWQISGLDPSKVYNLILFGQQGGNPADYSINGHDAGNGIGNPVTLDSEFDGNFTNVSPDVNGHITGVFSKRANEQFSSWAGIQILEGYTEDCGGMTNYTIHDTYINNQYNNFNTNGTITTEGTVNVAAVDGAVRFNSNSSVTLKPGFHAMANSDFIASANSICAPSFVEESPAAARRSSNALSQAIAALSSKLPEQTLAISPNPAIYQTTISFELPRESTINVGLFNMNGQQIKHLTSGEFTKGQHELRIQLQGLAAGMYYVQLQSSYAKTIQKIMVAR